jgi:monovalent cation:H+ antiporter-2, CPA2 family
MRDTVQLEQFLIILIAAVTVVSLFRRLRGSSVVGYLVAGALIGPSGLGLIHDIESTEGVARLGVVFLLFWIGLELSVERILALRRYVFGLGAAQVLVTTLVFWAALRAAGLGNGAALIIGAGLALSSTAVVLRMLVERRELSSHHGRIAFAVLLFQDLAVVPLLTLVPLLGGGGSRILPALSNAFAKTAIAFIAILALGRLALRPVLRHVAHANTPELFTGIVLLVVLGVAWITEQFGLSMALGAFLAGLMMAETEYRPQIEGDIQPFRGVLLGLFFMTVGMGLDLELLRLQALLILGLLLALLCLKAIILSLLSRAFRLPFGVGAGVGLMLAQGSEFGFVLFPLAQQAQVISRDVSQITVLVIGASMAVTPALLHLSGIVLTRLQRHPAGSHGSLADEAQRIRDHVVIAGFGRVGQTLGVLLESLHIPYVALDRDPELVAAARRHGRRVFFGDASQPEVLKAAGLERARLAVSTLDEPGIAGRAVQVLRAARSSLPILARGRDTADCEKLVVAGATAAVPEFVEGSLQLGGVLLRQLGQSPERIERLLEEFRQEAYARLAEITASPQI